MMAFASASGNRSIDFSPTIAVDQELETGNHSSRI
jgi:hypothetical protein